MKTKKQRTQAEMLLRIPNPMHLEACKRGGRVHKNKKAYTRKCKHKESYI